MSFSSATGLKARALIRPLPSVDVAKCTFVTVTFKRRSNQTSRSRRCRWFVGAGRQIYKVPVSLVVGRSLNDKKYSCVSVELLHVDVVAAYFLST